MSNVTFMTSSGTPITNGNHSQGPSGSTQPSRSLCCVVENGVRCSQLAGNASYPKRMEKMVVSVKHLVADPKSKHNYICEHHKKVIQNIRSNLQYGKRKRRDEEDGPGEESQPPPSLRGRHESIQSSSQQQSPQQPTPQPPLNHFLELSVPDWPAGSIAGFVPPDACTINLNVLPMATLRRYKKVFRYTTRAVTNREQLVEELNQHIAQTTCPLESEVINTFLYTLKYKLNKLDPHE